MATTLNYEAALAVVEEWLRSIEERTSARYTRLKELDDWFEERAPIVQKIAAAFDRQLAGRFTRYAGASSTPWVGTRDAAIRLRGLLRQRDEREQLFGRPGPKLDADALHRWVSGSDTDASRSRSGGVSAGEAR